MENIEPRVACGGGDLLLKYLHVHPANEARLSRLPGDAALRPHLRRKSASADTPVE